MSRAAKRAVESAAAVAERLGHASLESVHAAIALLDPGNEAALGSAGRAIDLEALAKRADAIYEGPRGKRPRKIEQSGEWREMLELAKDEADNAGATDIEPEHLFLAATADDGWSAARALREIGVDVEALRKDVAATFEKRDRAE